MNNSKSHANVREQKKYKAFFSYTRADSKIATWLHHKLDSYRTPRALVGTKGSFEKIPKSLHPIFRDREDLAGGGQLSERLKSALNESEALIVLCSPEAAKSIWVNEEIEIFKKSGRGARIFPVVADGLPEIENLEKEFFPKALKGTGILAADLREIKLPGGRVVGDGRYIGKLKLIAGLLGIELDQLRHREDVRKRRLTAILATTSLLFLFLAIATTWFGIEAAAQRDRAVDALGRVFVERAWQNMDSGNRFLAAKYALAGWRIAPSTEQEHRLVLSSILQESNDCLALMKHQEKPISTKFSPDGKLIVTTSEDGEVRLWDSKTGEKVRTFTKHDLKTTSAVFTPDGGAVVSASADGTVRIWEAMFGEEVRPFMDNEIPVKKVCISPDARHIVTFSEMVLLSRESRKASLWSVEEGETIWEKSLCENVLAMGFTTDNKGVIILNGTGSAICLNRLTGERYDYRSFSDGEEVTSAALDLTNDMLAFTDETNIIKIYNFSKGNLISTLRGHQGQIVDLAIAPSGKKIAGASTNGIVYIWSVKDGIEIAKLIGHEDSIIDVAFSKDENRLTTASQDNTVRVWNTGRVVADLECDGDVEIALSQDGKLMALASTIKLELFDIPTFRSVFEFRMPTQNNVDNGIENISFTSDTTHVIILDKKGKITVINIQNGSAKIIHQLDVPIWVGALSPTTNHVAYVGFDDSTSVKLLNTDDGNQDTLPGQSQSGVISSLAFSNDGSRLIAGSQQGWITVWEVNSREPVMHIPENPSPYQGVVFSMGDYFLHDVALSNDGVLAALVLRDKTIRIWDVNLHKEISILKQHEDFIGSANFSMDSRLVISGGIDGARIWDVHTGRMVAEFSKPTRNVVFTPDANYIVLGTANFFKQISGETRLIKSDNTMVVDVSILSQSMQDLATSVCSNFLQPHMHIFNKFEITSDLLIQKVWLEDGLSERSICK